MNAVIYTRASSNEQVKGTSLEVQEWKCREYCHSKNFEILKVLKKKVNRPKQQIVKGSGPESGICENVLGECKHRMFNTQIKQCVLITFYSDPSESWLKQRVGEI